MQLEMHLQEMQIEFENLVWERKQLEKKILVAIKDKKIMQAMLAELEDEHDDAIVKIEQLEDQVKYFLSLLIKSLFVYYYTSTCHLRFIEISILPLACSIV